MSNPEPKKIPDLITSTPDVVSIDRYYIFKNNITLAWITYIESSIQRINIYKSLGSKALFKNQYILSEKDIPIASFFPNESGWIYAIKFIDKVLVNE